MFGKTRTYGAAFVLMALVSLGAPSGAFAQDATWRVSKSSGEVWFTASGAQPAALSGDVALKPGDTIRTGENGRVLLMRGAETMMISANSVVGLPTSKPDRLSTTILQQAGTILLDVEKRNVQHFEVATPFLAAVVKGTQFRVTVSNIGSQVEVLRGQVQVSDYKTGQYALVNPAQVARVSTQGPAGLSLTGSGPLSPIQLDRPRSPLVPPMTVAMADKAVTAPASAQPQVQVPVVERRAERTFASPNATSSDTDWTSDLVAWGKGLFGIKGAKSREEDLVVVLALPLIIGFSVAVGASAMRRRRKNKP